MVTAPVRLEALKNLDVDGSGATLIFQRKKQFEFNFQVTNCEKIAIRKLNIDWDGK